MSFYRLVEPAYESALDVTLNPSIRQTPVMAGHAVGKRPHTLGE